MSQLSVGPTRYRDVVLTSWDRGMSDNESINVGTVIITNGSDFVHLLVDIELGGIGHWT